MKLKEFISKTFDLWYKFSVNLILIIIVLFASQYMFNKNNLIVFTSYFLMIILLIHIIKNSIVYLSGD